tara:strand:- start:1306 stop:1455 length:150 start_codon:yes stop_codon:yes gene_type:complete
MDIFMKLKKLIKRLFKTLVVVAAVDLFYLNIMVFVGISAHQILLIAVSG